MTELSLSLLQFQWQYEGQSCYRIHEISSSEAIPGQSMRTRHFPLIPSLPRMFTTPPALYLSITATNLTVQKNVANILVHQDVLVEKSDSNGAK